MERNWSTQQILTVTGFSAAYLGQLESRGIVARSSKNTWPMPKIVRAILRHYREAAKRGSSGAEAKVRAARLRDLEVRTAMRLRTLVPTESSLQFHQEMVGRVLIELSGLPARYTMNRTERERLDDEVRAMRDRLADFASQLATKFKSDEEFDVDADLVDDEDEAN